MHYFRNGLLATSVIFAATFPLVVIVPAPVAGGGAPMAGAPQAQSGNLYVRNYSQKKFTIEVHRRGAKLVDTQWTINPEEGKKDPKGIGLSHKGQLVSLSKGDKVKVTFYLGDRVENVKTYTVGDKDNFHNRVKWNKHGYWRLYYHTTEDQVPDMDQWDK